MPKRSSVSRCAASACALRRRQVDEHRRQQALALEAARPQCVGDLLEQHALVRHVLVDDRHPLVVHGEDEGVAELPQRNHRTDIVRRGAGPRRRLIGPCAPGRTSLPGTGNARRSRARTSAARRRARGSSDCRPMRPASTPGMVIGRGSGASARRRRSAAARARARGRAPRRAPRRSTSWTSDCSRKRTSALVGMDVDVDAVGRNLDEQVDLRAALLDGRDAVGVGDRVRDGPVLDDAAVDEDVLLAADRPLVAERGDEPVDRQARRFLVDLDEVRRARRTAGRSARGTPAAGGHSSSRRPPLVSVKPTSG